MELFENLPGPLKNIVRKQSISCDELTEYGAKCGEKFIYSVDEFLFPERKDELKKIMINCTKFCLKHLSDLAINAKLLFGYESKNEKKIIQLVKEDIVIIGMKDGIKKMELTIDRSDYITFSFKSNVIKNMKEFKKTMIVRKRGYPKSFNSGIGYNHSARFQDGIIAKPWRKFIIDCFKYEDLDEIQLKILGELPDGDWKSEINNYTLALGNLGNIEIYGIESGYVYGRKIIQR